MKLSGGVNLLCGALLFAAPLNGCQQAKSANSAKWPKEAMELAVYATQLPIYPGAELEDAMGADLSGDAPEDAAERMTFWFQVEDPREEVIAWYDEQLPDADREESEEGDIIYTMLPDDGDDGETMGVRVDADGRLRIFEQTRKGKH